jgi:hypothetical protein
MLYEFIEDNNGDLIDIKAYCWPCGTQKGVEDNWPTTIETDCNQYCDTCEKPLAEGMNAE